MTDPTPRFHRPLVRHELASRALIVSAVERVAPEMIRVTVAGDELAGFTSTGPADHVKLFLPDPETGVIHTRLPGTEPTGPVLVRDFTPLPREDGSLDLDFYTHENPGPAASWALSVQPGDAARVAGPRGSRGVPSGVGRLILIADETALPSVRRWRELAAGVPATIIAMVGDDGAWVSDYLGAPEDLRVLGRSADEVIAVLTELGVAEDTFVWAAGEATELIPVRRYLRRELGLPKEQVSVDGYWRRGAADFDHHAPLDPSEPDAD
ncbi:siderophore-interacting protein [Microbacterium gorillae]|uniref:siderophore-interacting protein n=1 Tax=Microbacterium gorillae TaxID=1231063 RepID=UPI00058D72E3|nr:siderophore-interacting protein [Microbacterium gorillae]